MCDDRTSTRIAIVRYVDVDSCMVETVSRLNELGIATTGSCCGHARGTASVTVLPSSAVFARSLGFEVRFRPGADPEIIDPAKRLAEMPIR